MSKFSEEELEELAQIQEFYSNKKRIKQLEQQLATARREVDESAKDAFRRGWEQGKRECVEILQDYCKREMAAKGFGKGWQSLAADAIAAMEYGEDV